MSHIISLKVTKFQQPLPITLGVADEKPEGGAKSPPPQEEVRVDSPFSLFSCHFCNALYLWFINCLMSLFTQGSDLLLTLDFLVFTKSCTVSLYVVSQNCVISSTSSNKLDTHHGASSSVFWKSCWSNCPFILSSL